jgi:hypothetical protein
MFTATLNANGAHGRHGVHGRDGASGRYPGGRGEDGGDATPSTPGLPAGKAQLLLDTEAEGIRVQGSATGGETNGNVNICVQPAKLGQIKMSAIGGTGGNGANGGDGGHGAKVRFTT